MKRTNDKNGKMPTKGTRTNLLAESVLATDSQVQSVRGAIRHQSVIYVCEGEK